jgi:hypothetical protein
MRRTRQSVRLNGLEEKQEDKTPPVPVNNNDTNDNKLLKTFSQNNQQQQQKAEIIKQEPNFNESLKSPSASMSSTSSSSSTESYIFVEMNLISIDKKCQNYKELPNKFLCINSNALVNHIYKHIRNKMQIHDDLFEVNIHII